MMFVKLKNWYLRRKIGAKYSEMIKKNGHLLFKKKDEVTMNFLFANKRRNSEDEKYWKGWIDCADWLVSE